MISAKVDQYTGAEIDKALLLSHDPALGSQKLNTAIQDWKAGIKILRSIKSKHWLEILAV